ncbi:PilW family protein [Vibrio diazotrophicus]|uniref:PilW family protein n=1 Tax=Vibrio diazotrophicus TaxID=685 RepID=UPI0005A7A7A9|nr:prepilin-type N-terminal cleavage/methylation domain-containing protein [Vibrio diazotrophicus]
MKVRGFTLVEMVLTMVVGAILVLGIAGFVELGSKGYSDTVARQRLQTQAKFVLEKMTREIRHAVPNSFAVSSSAGQQCLSFYPIVYSGFYSVSGSNNKTMSFIVGNTPAPSSFDGLRMIINPSRQTDFAVGQNTNFPLSGSNTTFTLSSPLPSQSVAQRQFIYKDLVSYCLDFSAQSVTRNGIQVADSVNTGEFSYAQPTLQRGGVVHLALTFAQNGESSHFDIDVQVLNVP